VTHADLVTVTDNSISTKVLLQGRNNLKSQCLSAILSQLQYFFFVIVIFCLVEPGDKVIKWHQKEAKGRLGTMWGRC